ncbi:MAG: magnesium transporter CorA family protein [Erysipelotrichaceae bacterium]
MLNIYKTINNKVVEIKAFEKNCWISLMKPTPEEIAKVQILTNVEKDLLTAALDDEETSRIDIDDQQTLLIIDVPYCEGEVGSIHYETIPLGIITSDSYVISVCLKEIQILDDFRSGNKKDVHINFKTRFILQILYSIATRYLLFLRSIDRSTRIVEKKLRETMSNSELLQLLDYQKSLVFLSTSLKGNEATIARIQKGKVYQLYEEDLDLLDDVLIEFRQAIEMSGVYSNILTGEMNAFASIISNNVSIVMKTLTIVTILLAIPTMISGFYGMNVPNLPIPDFYFTILISIALTVIIAFILIKKKLF